MGSNPTGSAVYTTTTYGTSSVYRSVTTFWGVLPDLLPGAPNPRVSPTFSKYPFTSEYWGWNAA